MPVVREVYRMAESFGARLREQRERRQIPLTTIAEQTKIGLTLLEGLERDDTSRWPAGIFRRAFVKSYATAIGLEPDAVVREFQQVHPDPADVVAIPCNGVPVVIPEQADKTAPPSRMKLLVGSAFGSLFRDDPTAPPRETLPAAVSPETVPEPDEETPPAPWNPELSAAVAACTEFGRADGVGELRAVLAQATESLGAAGLIIWIWNGEDRRLRPTLAHGYADKILARVPPLRLDEMNATATAFRTAQSSMVPGTDTASGALAVPLMAPGGCVGVLAIEFHEEREQNEMVHAFATIFAALIVLLVWDGRCAVTTTEPRAYLRASGA
jgi:helix-turn-helix protein/GAF domain-containing protein